MGENPPAGAAEAKPIQPLPLEAVQYMERMDEDQILAEMRGELLRSYVYSFEVKGRRVTGLTYAGVRQAIRSRGHVAILPCPCCAKAVHVEEDESQYKALVRAKDLVNNVEVVGAATCAKELEFSYVIAVNKAERNALRKILPEKVVVQLIEEYLKGMEPKPGKPTREELIFATAPNTEDLHFVELAETWEVHPQHYLGEEVWQKIHSSLTQKFGAEWIRAGANSHWLISKRAK